MKQCRWSIALSCCLPLLMGASVLAAAPQITGISLTNYFLPARSELITNGLVSIAWHGDPGGKFDLLYASNLQPNGNTQWQLALANIQGSASGSNFVSDPPFLASPAFQPNARLFYRVRSLPPAPAPLTLHLETVAANLVSPMVLTHANDGSRRMFIAEQTGQIRVMTPAAGLLAPSFLALSSRMVPLYSGYDERGLLGLAFHPGYASNGRFFVYYSAAPPGPGYDHQNILSEFLCVPPSANVADPASERVLLRIPKPQLYHEGGSLAFGPDGFLYLSTGDADGPGEDSASNLNAQNLTNLLGKILRLDVDSGSPYAIPADNPLRNTPGAQPEIFAWGLRNPWRFSFDRSGARQAFIGDAGQNRWEEVDVLRSGANFGWPLIEGNHAYAPDLASSLGVNIANLSFPIYEYGHSDGIAVVGGYVYRGSAWPALVGKYVFGDFSTSFATADGQLWYLAETRPGIWERFAFQISSGFGRYLKAFGEDEAGELYVLTSATFGPSGTTADIRRLAP